MSGSGPSRRSILTVGSILGAGGLLGPGSALREHSHGSTTASQQERSQVGALTFSQVPLDYPADEGSVGYTVLSCLHFTGASLEEFSSVVDELVLRKTGLFCSMNAKSTIADSDWYPGRSLSVNLGLGRRAFVTGSSDNGDVLEELVRLPVTSNGRLNKRASADILVQVFATDASLSVAASRHLLNGLAHTVVTWSQSGYRPPRVSRENASPRNILGFVDGTANPKPGSDEFVRAVHTASRSAMSGGTYMVVRKIKLDVDRWFALAKSDQEGIIGRTHGDVKLPVSGRTHGESSYGSHVAIAEAVSKEVGKMFRLGYTYAEEGRVGLLFQAYAGSAQRQITGVLLTLSQHDRLNQFARTVESEVFALPSAANMSGRAGIGAFLR